jgi:hypothetical protein
MPEINPIDHNIVEIYNLCSNARDGMSGALQYGVVMDVAKSRGMSDFEDLLYYTNCMEKLINEKRASAKK